MTEYHLVTQLVTDISYIKLRFLLTYPTIEYNVEQHVAQLLTYFITVVLQNRITQLERLFDGVWSQALVGLFAIPRALHPQPVHHIQ